MVSQVIKVMQDGLFFKAAIPVERPCHVVLRAGGGFHVDTKATKAFHYVETLCKQLPADSQASEIIDYRNPVKIITRRRTGNRAKTGISDRTALVFGKQKMVAASMSLSQAFLDQFNRHPYFFRRKET